MTSRAKITLILLWVFLASWSMATQGLAAEKGAVRQSIAAGDIFQGLDQAQVDRVAALGAVQQLSAGEVFYQAGRHTKKLFVMASGEADVILAGGKVVAQVGPGSVLGEIELADGLPATATVRMKGAGSAVVIEMAALRKLMAADPALGYLVMGNVARKIASHLRGRL